MAGDDDFITHLIGFGLTEKEAQCYFYLLKYGPKTPSPLAKALHTYREDVHRTLNSLIDKGMVRPSLDSPTVYTAVELESALKSALKKHEGELKEMELRKQELQELSKQQLFRPVEDIPTFKVIKNMKELAGVATSSIASIRDELLFIIPTRGLAIASFIGQTEVTKAVIARGGRVRGIADISCPDAACAGTDLIHDLLQGGAEMRYLEAYHGLYFAVSDRKTCMSVINADVKRVSLSEPITVLWADDRTYAGYLTSTFERLWLQAMPAEAQA